MSSVVVPHTAECIQFFELWLNAKLRHGNTVVLKIRNSRGQIKELRILDWSRLNLWWRMTARCSTASRRTELRDHGGGDGACRK
ncbi:hypothetical protein OHD13_16550 [Escherichia coli]|uniref:hypothetical protein n=1 Tax=Escherichia coli TaxID=562 RepID=UPI002237BA0B|nr:hypothetical protein [Escherichia coli]MCW7229610.1 hypothetical protein [Escherichia coli]